MKRSASSVRGARKRASAKSTKRKTVRNHEEPSTESLREIPPVDFSKGIVFGRGPSAIQKALAWARTKRGRPKKGERAAGTVTRSVRLPEAAWKALERVAKKEGTTVHALIRQAVLAKLGDAA
jgi:hypothetical protein